MTKMKGFLLTYEGGDCAGKGTQIKLLVDWLKNQGLTVRSDLYEPGSTDKTDIIRTLLKNRPDTDRLNPDIQKRFALGEYSEQFAQEKVPPIAEYFIKKAMEKNREGVKKDILEFILADKIRASDPGNLIYDSMKKNLFEQGNLKAENEYTRSLEKIRQRKFSSKNVCKELLSGEKLDPETQAWLFLAARNMLYHNIIQQSLLDFDVTIIDRSKDSTTVYQGHAQNPNLVPVLRGYNLMATEGIIPNKTILLDIPEEEVILRRAKRQGVEPDFFDSQGKEFHKKVRRGYLEESQHYAKLPECNPEYGRIEVINGQGKPEKIFEKIKSNLEYLI